ncbi:MAG: tetratricopeptide repeat protein [Bacteroidetes bacterium]|nr:tetratricopeptide repeat protein [Bacteroidota bacterium]
MKKILLALFTCMVGLTAFAQTDLLDAEREFNNGNMRGALTLFRKVLESDPMNYTAQFGEAECYYRLKKYSDAFTSLDKATNIKQSKTKEVILFYAKCYHRTGDLDRAISEYKAFLKVEKPKSYPYQEAEKYIKECEFAKRKMAKPSNVKVYNIGEEINSRFEEYAPSITSDGKLLVFTSRRENTTSPEDRKGKHLDENGDYKFYEDIYYSQWDAASNSWSDCLKAGGAVNTTDHDAVLSISPDGHGIYVYKNSADNAGDIYFSKMTDKLIWKEAEKLPKTINSSYFEGSTSETADGKMLYFVSERLGGLGLCDIYYAEKSGGSWGKPENIGATINTPGDEKFVFIHPNGKTLFFASDGHLGLGSYDIYKTEYVNGMWTKPINLGYPINTVNEESTFSLTADNSKMFVAAEYASVSDENVANYGERDIYMVDISNYPLMNEGYEKSVFAQLIAIVSDANSGAPLKGVSVTVESLEDGEVYENTTDKIGYARINLRGDAIYKITAKKGDKTFTEEVKIEMNISGETVQKWEIRL